MNEATRSRCAGRTSKSRASLPKPTVLPNSVTRSSKTLTDGAFLINMFLFARRQSPHLDQIASGIRNPHTNAPPASNLLMRPGQRTGAAPRAKCIKALPTSFSASSIAAPRNLRPGRRQMGQQSLIRLRRLRSRSSRLSSKAMSPVPASSRAKSPREAQLRAARFGSQVQLRRKVLFCSRLSLGRPVAVLVSLHADSRRGRTGN